MRLRGPAILGIGIGLAGALLVLGYGTMRRHMPGNPMLGDYGGPIRAVVMQYARGSDFVAPVFKQYLGYQGAGVTVYMACPGEEDFKEITGLIGPVKCRLVPVYTGHEQTSWSRDRWVALASGASGVVTVLSPKGELGAETWPQRAGDSRIGEDLARALPEVFHAQRSGLFFDGGDYLADGEYVFATRALLERNLQHTVTTRDKLLEAIGQELHLTPVLLEEGPGHHAGMFMMAAGPDARERGRRVMVVADPSLGKTMYAGGSGVGAGGGADAAFTGGPDFSADTQKRYDAVAAACVGCGYKVVRTPVAPAAAGKMYMTYVNVILDRTDGGGPVVYMSSYGGQEKMNAAAAAVWAGLGYEVRPIDCSTVWQKGGTLHCLVNVCRRGE